MKRVGAVGYWSLGVGEKGPYPNPLPRRGEGIRKLRAALIAGVVSVLCTNAHAEPPAPETPVAQPAATGPSVKTSEPAKKSSSKKSVKNDAKNLSQPAAAAKRSADRLELDTSVVTGNRELPKVLYIVPWKKADLGDLPAQPFNTLLDEALTPVDRDVFRREVSYYQAVAGGASGAGQAGEDK